jgi:hypothetical protein
MKEFTRIELPDGPNNIFVFGSNLAGVHGAGAAKYAAKHYGARRGIAFGLYGRSFAIPTRNHKLITLPLSEITEYVNDFLLFARLRPELEFYLTQIGCGYAGYTPAQIAPMFKEAPGNVVLPPEFREALGA